MQADPTAAPASPTGGTVHDGAAPRISVGAVAFDMVLLFFVSALLLTLPSSDSARLVPLLILVPTFVGIAYQLYVDLTPGRRVSAEEEPTPADVRRRQLLFVAWILAFFAAAWLTSFLVVIPIALFAIFRFANRESLLLSVVLAGGMSVFVFVLFGLVLGIRF